MHKRSICVSQWTDGINLCFCVSSLVISHSGGHLAEYPVQELFPFVSRPNTNRKCHNVILSGVNLRAIGWIVHGISCCERNVGVLRPTIGKVPCWCLPTGTSTVVTSAHYLSGVLQCGSYNPSDFVLPRTSLAVP